MRILCLTFPRLAVQLARKRRPDLAGRPVVLLAGEGDAALVSAASVEAAAAGVEIGMTAAMARERCPAATVLPDNASGCLEQLDAITSMIHARATPFVAIASREQILVDLQGLEATCRDEASAASAILGLVRTWTALDVRAGVASSRTGAAEAARTARRCAQVLPHEATIEAPIAVQPRPQLQATHTWQQPAPAVAARARLVRMLGALQVVLEARGESFREVRLDLHRESSPARYVTLRSQAPLHRATEVLDLIAEQLSEEDFDGLRAARVSLARLGPEVTVKPWRRPVAVEHELAGPPRPLQRHLLRAG